MISKQNSVTIAFRNNGFEVTHYEDNPNYRERRYSKAADGYDETYDPEVHVQKKIKRNVFTTHADMIKFVNDLTQ